MGLRIVGKELPELLGDGYLVYLLHHSSPLIIQAAVECCSNSARNSRMLIPALLKHLPNAVLRPHLVEALKWFDSNDLWEALCQYTEAVVCSSEGPINSKLEQGAIHNTNGALSGALKVVEARDFPFEDKLELLLHLVDTLIVGSKSTASDDDDPVEDLDILQFLFGKDGAIEELVVDGLIKLVGVLPCWDQLLRGIF